MLLQSTQEHFYLLISRVAIINIKRKQVLVQTCSQSHLSVGRSDRSVYCDKTADWIWMPFRVMSGLGRGMGVLDGDGDRRWEGAVLG